MLSYPKNNVLDPFSFLDKCFSFRLELVVEFADIVLGLS